MASPGSHFAESYEKNIFLRFRSKFRSAKLLRVFGEGQRRVLELRLAAGNKPYSLVMIVNDKNQVRRVYRQIVGLPIDERERQDSALQWLGSLLYRCDASDRQTLEDLLYQKDIQMAYENSHNKTEVIRRLLKDFPGTVGYRNISVEERDGAYRIALDLANLELLKVEIPSRLAVLNEVNELRDLLLSDLQNSLRSTTAVAANEVEFFRALPKQYADLKRTADMLTIPYPTERSLQLTGVDYMTVTDEVPPMQARLTLDYDESKSTVLINQQLPVAVRGDVGKVDEDQLRTFTKALQLTYDMFLFSSEVQHPVWTIIKGKLSFRNKQNVELPVENGAQWQQLWSTLAADKGLYFYPSWIEREEDAVILEGALYMLKDTKFDLYHLAEVRFRFALPIAQEPSFLRLSLYSWLRNSEELQ
ncbi:MAG: hypothetical protein ACRBF0_19680 [Calditrichia bacterium]